MDKKEINSIIVTKVIKFSVIIGVIIALLFVLEFFVGTGKFIRQERIHLYLLCLVFSIIVLTWSTTYLIYLYSFRKKMLADNNIKELP